MPYSRRPRSPRQRVAPRVFPSSFSSISEHANKRSGKRTGDTQHVAPAPGRKCINREATVSVAAGSQKSRTHVCSYERNVEDLWISLQSAIPFRLSAHAPVARPIQRDRQSAYGHRERRTYRATDCHSHRHGRGHRATNTVCKSRPLPAHSRPVWSPHMRCHLKQRVTNWQASFRSILAD